PPLASQGWNRAKHSLELPPANAWPTLVRAPASCQADRPPCPLLYSPPFHASEERPRPTATVSRRGSRSVMTEAIDVHTHIFGPGWPDFAARFCGERRLWLVCDSARC